MGASGSVRASSRPHLATWARVVHTFWPLTTHSSPSRSARVLSAARSEPAPGSLNIWHQISSQRTPGAGGALLLLAAVGDERRAGHADAHHVDERLLGAPGGAEPLVDDLLQPRVEAEPAAAPGKWIHASPRSNWAAQNSSARRGRRVLASSWSTSSTTRASSIAQSASSSGHLPLDPRT